MKRALFLLLFALIQISAGQDPSFDLKKWSNFDYSHKLVNSLEIKPLKLAKLQLLRGIVFGKHGRVFKEADIQDFLEAQDWYHRRDDFKNEELDDTERKNLDLIRGAESAKHPTVQPGDLRFWRARLIEPSKIRKHNLSALHIMRAEIEAIHGKTFADEPPLQAYFEDRYWYKPAAKYDPKVLTGIERQNIERIWKAEKAKRDLKIAPGDMLAWQNQPLKPETLKNAGLFELRLLRNEVYALRGWTFSGGWLSEHFESQPWYHNLHNNKKVVLSPIEIRNVALILKRENAIHEQLGDSLIPRQLLNGLFVEDARKLRNEVYARHGKVFKQKWLQSYFASFAWYQPDPSFSEKSLSPIEKANVDTILAYEKKAQSQFEHEEG